ncbi:MAG: extracellular solute-binding protein, partial [Acidimicrobiales bacterium]
NFTWYPFLWMGGGSPISPDQRHSTFDSPATRAALRLWQQAIQLGAAPRQAQGTGGNDSISNLASGYCAMQQTGVWAVGEIAEQKPGFRFGAAPLPLPPGGKPITTAGGWALCANARGRDPETASRFIVWALGTDDPACIERGRQWNTRIKKNLPVRGAVRRAAERAGDFDSPVYRMFAERIAPAAVGEPRYPVEVYRAISDALQACQLDGADPSEAAADAGTQIDNFLATYEGASIL